MVKAQKKSNPTPLTDQAHSQVIHQGLRFIVYRVLDHQGKSKILKTVRLGPSSQMSAARLVHEYSILRRFNLQGVVHAIRLEETQGLWPALVLEDAGIQNLKQWLKHKPLKFDLFLDLSIQLAEALKELHQANIVHLKINPFNIIISEPEKNPHLTLIDFGVAADLSLAVPKEEEISDLELRLEYIAPEQTRRLYRTIDHRTDLYSLGATFYEMLSGSPPFALSDPAELIHAHVARIPIPLDELNPQIPKILSQIVLKLLSKMPEHRYQSAEALAFDLHEARRRWKNLPQIPKKIDLFELARIDIAKELSLDQGKLYERNQEIADLSQAIDRIGTGQSEVWFVIGPAGIGKSALVRALRPKAVKKAHFLTGKFLEFQGNVPYATLKEAFHEFFQKILSEPEESRNNWKNKIKNALGSNAAVIAEALPELKSLIGELPPPVTVGSLEAENRFLLVFQNFIQVVATEDHPLVLFLDDLQWIDSASLKLFEKLVTSADIHYFLLFGSYRSDEVNADHALSQTLERIQASGSKIKFIELKPLHVKSIHALLSDLLKCQPESVLSLAELIDQKTAGNPFFIERFLRHIHQEGFLYFDVNLKAWDWNIGQIAKVAATENVISFMISGIKRLPDEVQSVLKFVSCFRSSVNLDLIAYITKKPIEKMVMQVRLMRQQGLVVPDSADPRNFRFAHDKVQQAAYSTLSSLEQKTYHLKIGRSLLQGERKRVRSRDFIFEIVEQLNRGCDLIHDEFELLSLANLNFTAGHRSKSIFAFNSASGYFIQGTRLLSREAWKTHPDLWFRLHREGAECAYIVGNHSKGNQLVDEVLLRSSATSEKLDLCFIRQEANSVIGDFPESIRWGKEGLRLLGIDLPKENLQEIALSEFQAALNQLKASPYEKILTLSQMSDPLQLASMRILDGLVLTGWFFDQTLMLFAASRMVNLSLKYGNAETSAFAYVAYGVNVGPLTEDYAMGYALGEMSIELSRHFRNPRGECETLVAHGATVNHWRAPLRNNIDLFKRAIQIGVEWGAFQWAGIAAETMITTLFISGADLVHWVFEASENRKLLDKLGHQYMANDQIAFEQAVRCLQGKTAGRNSFEDETFKETEYLNSIKERGGLLLNFYVLKLQTSFLFGDYAQALDHSRKASEFLHVRRLLPIAIDHNVYSSLTRLMLAGRTPPGRVRAQLLNEVAQNQKQLDSWQKNCPQNFQHKYSLVSAEVARIEKQPMELLLKLYDEGVRGASKEGFLQDVALTNELAGRYFLSLGYIPIATSYLQLAIEGYTRWGATEKANLLQEELAGFSVASSLRPRPIGLHEISGGAIDLLSLLKASETISSEVRLSSLLEKLMSVCLEIAGAQRGAILLEEGGVLAVRALSQTSEKTILEKPPPDQVEPVPKELIAHVFRSGESILYTDAQRQGRTYFTNGYLREHGTKSVLAIPIRRQAKSMGILYLENNLTTGAFSPNRLKTLELLSSQIAISIEISLLFEERNRAEREARFLAEASAKLGESLNYDETLNQIARLTVPILGEGCTIDVIGNDQKMRRIAAVYSNLIAIPILKEQRVPSFTNNLRELGVQSFLALPLAFHDKKFGTLTLYSNQVNRYGARETELAQELAHRCAMTIESSRLYDDAQRSIETRDSFIAIASHELKTPLTPLTMQVELIQRHLQDDALQTPSRRQTLLRLLEDSSQQIQQLNQLVSNLLDVSRIRAGRMVLTLQKVNLSELVKNVVKRYEVELIESNYEVHLDAEGEVLGFWDRSRVEQIITNLLSNAIKYGAGKPIDILVFRKNGKAILRVTDHGIGISKENQANLFEPFARVAPIQHFAGIGLGLYITCQIVIAHEGEIHVESRLGLGSAFTVGLPLMTLGMATSSGSQPR